MEELLASPASSTCSNYECIVIDDASTDDSAAVTENGGARIIRKSLFWGFSPT